LVSVLIISAFLREMSKKNHLKKSFIQRKPKNSVLPFWVKNYLSVVIARGDSKNFKLNTA
jgi:hypothetical protein